jgi:hypothetical protein
VEGSNPSAQTFREAGHSADGRGCRADLERDLNKPGHRERAIVPMIMLIVGLLRKPPRKISSLKFRFTQLAIQA